MNGFDDLERQLRAKVATSGARRRRRPPVRTLIVAATLLVSAGGVTAAATGVIGGPGDEERGVKLLNAVIRDTQDLPACHVSAPDRRPALLSALPASDLALRAFPQLRRPPTPRERALARRYGRMAGQRQVLSGGARVLRATDGTRFVLMITAGRGKGLGRGPECMPVQRAALERRAPDADPAALAYARRFLDREERRYRANIGREGLLLLVLRENGRLSSGAGTYSDAAVRLGTGGIGVARVGGEQRTAIDGLVPAPADHVLVRSRARPDRAPLRIAVPERVFHAVLPKGFGDSVAVEWRSASGKLLHVLRMSY
jgi:hypothetical protein